MLFLAPIMLAGLAAIAAPVVIHLRDRSRSPSVEWPSLRFIKVARQRSARRSKLKNWLVLLARCLILALLAVAMAQPYRTDDSWDKPPSLPTTLVLVLDNSYSMGYRESMAGGGSEGGEAAGPVEGEAPRAAVSEAGTRFARAKELALQQLAGLSLEDEVALVVVNEQALTLTDRPTRDTEQVRKLIASVRLSDRGTDMGQALNAAFAVGRRDADAPAAAGEEATAGADSGPRPPRKAWRHVMVFTDMQLGGWREVVEQKLLEKVAAPLPVTLVNLGEGGSPNRFLRQVRVSDQAAGGRLSVEAEVAGRGGGAVGGEQATLWIDDRKAGSPAVIQPGSSKITLRAPLPGPGVHTCAVALDADRLPIDDRAFFAINVSGGSHVTIVDGDPSAIPAMAETFYLNAALDLIRAKTDTPTLDRMTPADLSTTPLSRGGALLLCNVPRLDGSALTRVENFLRAGGSVLVTLGDKTDPAHCNQDWHFLPIKLDRMLGNADRSRAYSILVEQNDHPIFGGVLDLTATRYFAFIGADPTSLKNNGRVLASFSNGAPFLVEGAFGGRAGDDSPSAAGGRVLLMTGPLDADWSNLPYRRAFVPLVDRLVSYLTRQRMSSRSLALGQPVNFAGPGTLDRKTITVTAPDGTVQTLTAALDAKAHQAVAVYRDTQMVGVYRVDADEGFNTGGAFAVNLDTKESVLTAIDPEEVRRAFGANPVRIVESTAGSLASWNLEQSPELTQKRTEYWPALLLAAFVGFMVETVLANYFTRRRRSAAPPTTEYLGTRRSESIAGGIEAAGREVTSDQ